MDRDDDTPVLPESWSDPEYQARAAHDVWGEDDDILSPDEERGVHVNPPLGEGMALRAFVREDLRGYSRIIKETLTQVAAMVERRASEFVSNGGILRLRKEQGPRWQRRETRRRRMQRARRAS